MYEVLNNIRNTSNIDIGPKTCLARIKMLVLFYIVNISKSVKGEHSRHRSGCSTWLYIGA